MPLLATIEKLPEGRAFVTLAGSMTLGTSLKVADSQIHSAIADGITRIVVDLSGVDYVDSAGLGTLVFIYGTLNEKNGALRLCGVSPRVLSLLQLTKTDTFLAVDPSREASLAALAD
jgi:anti-sigma B factor antagonist